MESEWNLSSKYEGLCCGCDEDHYLENCYREEHVREFIKRFKEIVPDWPKYYQEVLSKRIDKLAGDKLC